MGGRGWAGWNGVGGEWDNYNSIINKYIFFKSGEDTVHLNYLIESTGLFWLASLVLYSLYNCKLNFYVTIAFMYVNLDWNYQFQHSVPASKNHGV